MADPISKHGIVVVTEGVPSKDLEDMFMKRVVTVEEALPMATAMTGMARPRITYLPYAAEVIPVCCAAAAKTNNDGP